MKEINQFFKNKRAKILGIFIVAGATFVEVPLRLFCHKVSEILLYIMKETFLVGRAEAVAREIFTQSSPLIFLYFPAMIGLIIIIKDGFQKTDWFLGPVLIGILFKAGIYGLISLKHQSGEFWLLTQAGAPQFLLNFFIFLFIFVGLTGLLIWMKNIIDIIER